MSPSKRSWWAYSPRTFTAKVIALGAFLTFLLTVYIFIPSSSYRLKTGLFNPRTRSSCSPEAYSNGQWTWSPKTNVTAMTNARQAMDMAGFEGCAADREFFWHLGSDHEEMWGRFPNVTNYEWTPSRQCNNLRPLNRELLVQDMVEQGGWLLIGDSVTENHFFSLSCILYPHVRATPNYTENPYFERHWPQNLYLREDSPLIPSLNFPVGFNLSVTPLVTFRRVDLLLSGEQLEQLHRETYHDKDDFQLFSKELYWSMAPSEYLEIFQKPLPEANYGTLIVSTAGHWTTTLMSGFRDESKENDGYGIDNVLKFFRVAMKKWADDIQAAMDVDEGTKGGHRRQVVVRAYLPGHENCHNLFEPYKKPVGWQIKWYNWPWILDFDRIFGEVVSSSKYRDIHYLGIERPALLRPDAHAAGDCLHIMTGAGVLEGWSHYIWHYITREIPGTIR
ncbi:hypothetical protein C8Q75DRAFT_778140 [Abortiporus biennis]|nr:hypothetical protein C8Q75DRAFT_778140 [Abortiporus biennis]